MMRTMFADGKCSKLATQAGRRLHFTTFAPQVQAANYALIKELESSFESGVYNSAVEEEEKVASES